MLFVVSLSSDSDGRLKGFSIAWWWWMSVPPAHTIDQPHVNLLCGLGVTRCDACEVENSSRLCIPVCPVQGTTCVPAPFATRLCGVSEHVLHQESQFLPSGFIEGPRLTLHTGAIVMRQS